MDILKRRCNDLLKGKMVNSTYLMNHGRCVQTVSPTRRSSLSRWGLYDRRSMTLGCCQTWDGPKPPAKLGPHDCCNKHRKCILLIKGKVQHWYLQTYINFNPLGTFFRKWQKYLHVCYFLSAFWWVPWSSGFVFWWPSRQNVGSSPGCDHGVIMYSALI